MNCILKDQKGEDQNFSISHSDQHIRYYLQTKLPLPTSSKIVNPIFYLKLIYVIRKSISDVLLSNNSKQRARRLNGSAVIKESEMTIDDEIILTQMQLDEEEVIIHDIKFVQQHLGSKKAKKLLVKCYQVQDQFYVLLNSDQLHKQSLLNLIEIAVELHNQSLYVCIKKNDLNDRLITVLKIIGFQILDDDAVRKIKASSDYYNILKYQL